MSGGIPALAALGFGRHLDHRLGEMEYERGVKSNFHKPESEVGQTMTKGTARRSVRISDDLWEQAQEVAGQCGDNLSEIIRDRLRIYIEESKGAGRDQ